VNQRPEIKVHHAAGVVVLRMTVLALVTPETPAATCLSAGLPSVETNALGLVVTITLLGSTGFMPDAASGASTGFPSASGLGVSSAAVISAGGALSQRKE